MGAVPRRPQANASSDDALPVTRSTLADQEAQSPEKITPPKPQDESDSTALYPFKLLGSDYEQSQNPAEQNVPKHDTHVVSETMTQPIIENPVQPNPSIVYSSSDDSDAVSDEVIQQNVPRPNPTHTSNASPPPVRLLSEQITEPSEAPPPPSHPLMFVHTNDLERLAAQRNTPIITNIRPLNPSLSEQFKSLRIKVFDDHVPTERSEEFYSISFEFFMQIDDFKGAALSSKVEVFLTKILSDCADHAVEVLESLNSIVHVRVTVSCAIALDLLQELIVNGAEATIDKKSRTITTFRGCYRASVMFVKPKHLDKVSTQIQKSIKNESIKVDIVSHVVNRNQYYNLELLFISSKPFSPESIFKGRSTADCLYAGKVDKFQFTVIPFQHYAHHSSCLEVVYYPFEEPTDDYLAALSAANPCVREELLFDY
ncbi:hypothetical protein GEMRC1_010729 [Eukaryota sp. GEM-RC1]